MGSEQNKRTNQNAHEVKNRDNADWSNAKYDAKEKGNGSYGGDGGKDRKNKQPEKRERVVVNGHKSFDIKI